MLIATGTLAWGVNLPAHLVVVKGTEYYDGKTKRYVDMPITDVLQMMGRAGRPQYDNQGIAVILVSFKFNISLTRSKEIFTLIRVTIPLVRETHLCWSF